LYLGGVWFETRWDTRNPELFVVAVSPVRQLTEQYLTSGHDRFLSLPCRFIIY